MEYEWDEAKAAANLDKHGVAFDQVSALEWTSAVEILHLAGGEARVRAMAQIGDRLHICVYVDRGARRRIISLRRANRREVAFYSTVVRRAVI